MSSAKKVATPLVLTLLFAGCNPTVETADSARRTGVQVTDLVLETWRDDGAQVIVRAERARFESLPGTGPGELEEVELTHISAQDTLTTAVGSAAGISDDGSLTLVDATLNDREGNLRFTADEITIDPLGGVRARRVRARMRVQ